MAAKSVSMKLHRNGGLADRIRFSSAPTELLNDAHRPARGLKFEAALERWSAPEDYAAMQEYADAPVRLDVATGFEPPPAVVRSHEYERRRNKVLSAFDEKLQDGRVLASAIHEFGNTREVLEIDLWEILWIDHDFEEIVGEGRRYLKPEFFEPGAIPRNIRRVPDWLVPVFEHDHAYRNVILRGRKFQLGELQGKVVAALHEASNSGSPWLSGKKLLGTAGAGTTRMLDLFKSQPDWRDLIESGGGGLYRLRI